MAVEKRISAAIKAVQDALTVEKKRNTGVVKQGLSNPVREDPLKSVGVVHKKPPTQDKIIEETNAALRSVRNRTGA